MRSKRGAKTAGRKKELVERLELYDQNQNFQWSLPSGVPEAPEVDDWPFSSITEKDRGKVPTNNERGCRGQCYQPPGIRQIG